MLTGKKVVDGKKSIKFNGHLIIEDGQGKLKVLNINENINSFSNSWQERAYQLMREVKDRLEVRQQW